MTGWGSKNPVHYNDPPQIPPLPKAIAFAAIANFKF